MERVHQIYSEATSEKGGGERIVEERPSRTMNEIYARMLQLGEIQKASLQKHQTHGRREKVLEMMKKAKKVPQYMENSDFDQIKKELSEQETKINSYTIKDKKLEELKRLKERNEIKLLNKEIQFQKEIGGNNEMD